MDDDYKKMLRSMDDLIYPYRSIQDDIESLLKPQLEFQDQVSPLLEPYDRARSYLDAMENPALKIQEEIRRNLYSSQTIKSQLEKFLNPHLEAQKQLEELLRPQKWIQDQPNDLLKPQADFIASVRSQLEPVALAHDQIADLINPLNKYLSELQSYSINVDAVGNVLIDGEEIAAEEISAATSTFEAAQKSVRDFLHGLVAWLGQLTPRLRPAVLFLILPYVISVVANLTTPIYDEWWKEHVTTDPRVAKKEIILEAHELYDSEDLADYRFVYATRLHVRAEASMRAKIIDNIYLGKTVRVIRREKAWTEVDYLNDSTGEICTGWMYSRYLHKFER